MKLELILLSEISQIQKDRYCMSSLICGFKKSYESRKGKKGTNRREGEQGKVIYVYENNKMCLKNIGNKFW
jgi:DUF2075 family protein